MGLVEFVVRNRAEVAQLTLQHLWLSAAATAISVGAGVPLGVLLTRRPALRRGVLAFANVVQTIPSLALFGFLIPLPFLGGVGARTAVVALSLYALLPVLRATVAGIDGVDPAVRDAGRGMGMTDRQLLLLVELPLAAGVILSGVRVATVLSIGVTTIAAAIGAGGLGTYIFRGVAMVNDTVILAGAVPAAALALAADWGLGLLQNRLTRRVAAPASAAAAASGDTSGTGDAGAGAGVPAGSAAAGLAGAARRRRRRVRRLAVAAALVALAGTGTWLVWRAARAPARRVVIGSKAFSEQVVLAEIVAQAIERRTDLTVERRLGLGGTSICQAALLAGEIDLYVEYTGTALTAVLGLAPAGLSPGDVRAAVGGAYRTRFGLEWTAPFGFENTFAMIVRADTARATGVRRLSDIAPHAPSWRGGFGYEFTERPDGLAGLESAYAFHLAGPPLTMDLSLTYRALADGKVDLIAGNSTDGAITQLGLVVLEDDRRYFPPYEAAPVVRADTLARYPALRPVLDALGGSVSEGEMRAMNLRVDAAGADPKVVALDHLRAKGL
ncbi:MAG TPA: ABC transporter permease/substrate-binding protein [Myxococcota bacterium]|jgi:osmoprotectant transport system permease protein|nr:ABC transporter permease/substrate-binding protein [Myxococcota bacterium]